MARVRTTLYAAALVLACAAAFSVLNQPGRAVATKAAPARLSQAIVPTESLGSGVFVMEPREAPPRVASLSASRGFTERPSVAFPVVPLDPQVGFVVDEDALDWLPRKLDLRAGDAVLKINDEPVASTGQLLDAVRGTSEGSAVELRVRRSSTGEVLSYWTSP